MVSILSIQNLKALHIASRKAIQSGSPLSVICFGLDSFQAFRRQFGFKLGDQVLNHVQSVASEVFGNADLLRADDEDCFLATIPAPAEEAREQAERFRIRIGSSKFRFSTDGNQTAHTMTVSIGIADCVTTLTAQDLALQALSAWSVAREQGNSVSSYHPQDCLTGLVSGSAILDALDDALDQASTASQEVSVIRIDVDGFTRANAAQGYGACDQLLIELSSALTEQFGNDGTVGRLWSDEFMIILTNVRTEDAAFRAEDVRRRFSEQQSAVRPASLSVGVATFPGHAADASELMRKVREARYRSRAQGGGCTCVAEVDQMVTKTSHFSKIQLKRLAALAKSQNRSEAAVLREGLDALLQIYEDGAPMASIIRHPLEHPVMVSVHTE